jgi:hypothetical protein
MDRAGLHGHQVPAALHDLHNLIERKGQFETTASRMLIDAIKTTRPAT